MGKGNKRNKEITPFYKKFIKRKPLSPEELELAYQIVKRNRCECLICGKEFRNLGGHLWQSHDISAKEYKEFFSLPYSLPLISDETKQKKSEANKRKKMWKYLIKYGKKYRFQRGKVNPNRRISYYQRKNEIEKMKKYHEKLKKEWRICHVCGMRFHHLENHLFRKHGLVLAYSRKAINR